MKTITESTAALLEAVRKTVPLVHNITNYVTVNDVANALLAIGASPIMADDVAETEDITGIAAALVLNIGTLNQRTVASMLASGKRANACGIPVILDPVGAGASKLRNDVTKKLLDEVQVTILRGNLSEISFVAGLKVATKGVDAAAADAGNDSSTIAKEVARRLKCMTAITGAQDVISDGQRLVKITNGHEILSKVTGTGCMTTALIGALAGAGQDYFSAAVGGVAAMGIAGEIAFEKAGNLGTGSFHIALIDAISHLDSSILLERAALYEE
ncbi:MAG: hydroxyethylthiazole kinase [Lachnospiraceae bacterium]